MSQGKRMFGQKDLVKILWVSGIYNIELLIWLTSVSKKLQMGSLKFFMGDGEIHNSEKTKSEGFHFNPPVI